jgi:hypothetical protein
VQLAYLRIETGRGGEMAPAARLQVERFPDRPEWRAAVARLLVAGGRLDEARAELERLAQMGFEPVNRDGVWLTTFAFAAEVAHATHHRTIAEQLSATLERFADLNVVVGDGVLYYGPVAHHLGLLAAARSQWDAAIARFEAAHRAEEKLGAAAWKARTDLAWAQALLARDAAPDRARAAILATSAAEAARANGMAALVEEVPAVESALWSRSERGARMRREAGPA